MYELVVLACIVVSPIVKPCIEDEAEVVTIVRRLDAASCVAARNRVMRITSPAETINHSIECRITGSGKS